MEIRVYEMVEIQGATLNWDRGLLDVLLIGGLTHNAGPDAEMLIGQHFFI